MKATYTLYAVALAVLIYFVYRGSGTAGSCSFSDWILQRCGGGGAVTSSSGS
jgi:hypothetical protein